MLRKKLILSYSIAYMLTLISSDCNYQDLMTHKLMD